MATNKKRFTTAAEDRAFMARKFADQARTWAVGDTVQSFHRGRDLPATTIAQLTDSCATLADGSVCHPSRLTRAQ